jgi:hypothetical protein
MRANKVVTDDYHATAKLVDRYTVNKGCGHENFSSKRNLQHQIQFARAVQRGFHARYLSYVGAAYLSDILYAFDFFYSWSLFREDIQILKTC